MAKADSASVDEQPLKRAGTPGAGDRSLAVPRRPDRGVRQAQSRRARRWRRRGWPASAITPDDVLHAVDRGVNFLNWPGARPTSRAALDAMSGCAIAGDGASCRESVVVCVQFGVRRCIGGRRGRSSSRTILATLPRTDYVDVLTFYYVEKAAEWRSLIGPGGALEYARAARRDGVIRSLGITSISECRSAAEGRAERGWWMPSSAAMIRYNARPPAAPEREVFPGRSTDGGRHAGDRRLVAPARCVRWGALLRPTPDDPPGFRVPRAPDWYRFVLQSPPVAVVLAAPASRAELDEDLEVLDAAVPLAPSEFDRLAEHGERVRRHAGRFP